MKLAFCGLPLAALLLDADGHDIVWAGVCRKDAIGTRRLSRRLGAGRVEIVPDLRRADVVARVRAAAPDLLVSWFWTKKIPKALLEVAPKGSLGVHPSMLPRHRGPDPTFWAIDSGDEVTGVSAHRLDEEYDTGAVYAQRALAIDPGWDAWTLAKRLDRPSLALLRETVGRLARGERLEPVPQDEARATSAPAPDDDDLALVWSWPAARLERRVRAAAPWPGAVTFLGDEEIVITKAEVTAELPRALAPGEAAVVDGAAVVRAADVGLLLLAGRDADDAPLDRAALARKVRALGGR